MNVYYIVKACFIFTAIYFTDLLIHSLSHLPVNCSRTHLLAHLLLLRALLTYYVVRLLIAHLVFAWGRRLESCVAGVDDEERGRRLGLR